MIHGFGIIVGEDIMITHMCINHTIMISINQHQLLLTYPNPNQPIIR